MSTDSTSTSARTIAVLTSGGDAPGMNAAVRAAVSVASARGLRVLGVRRGYRGLVDRDWSPLGREAVDGWARPGGSVLGTSRCPDFRRREVRARAIDGLVEAGVQGIVCIGGNGTLAGAHALAVEGGEALAVIGVPASIDNDIACSSLSIGVDTALNTIVGACDRILDTASAHDRTFIVEVMGRECGYLAMTGAVAAGADGTLFPEAGLGAGELVDRVVGIVSHAYDPEVARNRVLIVVAEGVQVPIAELKEGVDRRLREIDVPAETRVTVLGHIVRGGSPSALDRLIAARLAHAAVRAVERGDTDRMAGWHVLHRAGREPAATFELDPYVTFWPLDQVLRASRAISDGSSELSRWRVRLLREASPYMSF